jgi:hypothetical protein
MAPISMLGTIPVLMNRAYIDPLRAEPHDTEPHLVRIAVISFLETPSWRCFVPFLAHPALCGDSIVGPCVDQICAKLST